MKALFLVCAESGALDRLSNKLSVFNLISAIYVKQYPVQFARLVVGAVLKREPAEPNKTTVSLFSSVTDNDPIEHQITVNFGKHHTAHVMVDFEDSEIANPGVIRFWLEYNGIKLAEYEIDANLKPSAAKVAKVAKGEGG